MLEYVIDQLRAYPAIAEAENGLAEGDVRLAVADRVRPALIAAMAAGLDEPVLVVTGGVGEAEELLAELRAYMGTARLLHYRAPEVFPWETIRPDEESAGARLQSLAALEAAEPVVVVAPVAALMRRLVPPGGDLTSSLDITVGGSLDMTGTLARLVDMGYERVQVVETRGAFAVRGGILDIFPSTSQFPVRIELFGDEVESIRRFLVSSQQSVAPESRVRIFGCRDSRSADEAPEDRAAKLRKQASSETATVADYLPEDALIVLDEPKRIHDDSLRHLARVSAADSDVRGRDFFLSAPELSAMLSSRRRLDLFLVSEAAGGLAEYSMASRPIEPALGVPERIAARVTSLRAMGTVVVACVRDEGHGARLRELLSDARVPVLPPGEVPREGLVAIEVAPISNGFVLQDAGLAVIAHDDLFPRAGRMRADHQTSAVEAARILSGLRAGDYVVHESHGVAVYGGIESKDVDGRTRDYLVLTYAEGDRLFVPVEQIARVSRYVGPEGKAPKVTRLSTNDWARATAKARASVKKLAFDLAKLYAERSTIVGHAFATDTVWQSELESAFPFTETPDQLAAIAAVKSDMEQAKPMDRLVCGDVGYGKTEVAIRAAAKAVLDNRQVIVLAPTTILAQQHYVTFSERFAPFPVRIEMLSRFRSQTQQKQILKDFALGKVDILIGTHRLLQKDVVPKDLGLVVVDEEQRFGVGHKEHLKNMRKAVDVLTLTATPIPRTLQMSVAGVRDLSIIDTPPEDRFEVATEVGAYDPAKIRDAIARETDRDGQVFYVYNRVQTIAGVARRVRELAPDARVAVAHGRMHEHELEKVMSAFLARETDVLVCTTIIESGIDIPTANTLIVDRAERLGLGQLYQLRGRVGRSHHRAYAYFFFSEEAVLTHAALERLATIREFTQLGSGMKIAMRDLEIRGAGNILGPEQHGHMAAVGFELYLQMLRDAIAGLQGEEAPERAAAHIALPVEAYLPKSYIAEEDLRVEAYRQIADAADEQDVLQVRRQLADRYGPPPAPANALLDVAELRVLADSAGVLEVAAVSAGLRIDFQDGSRDSARALASRRGGTAVRGADRIIVPAAAGPGMLAEAFDVLRELAREFTETS